MCASPLPPIKSRRSSPDSSESGPPAMDIPTLISTSIRRAVNEVFATMLSVELGPSETIAVSSEPEWTEEVVSFIGLAGAWVGTGTILCSPSLACRICSQMLMTDANAVNEEVLDAMGELTNMVIGSVKNDLEQHLGQLGLSIPTVIFGRNVKTKSMSHADWVAERFRWDGDPFLVKLGIAPNQKHAPMPPHSGRTLPIEIQT